MSDSAGLDERIVGARAGLVQAGVDALLVTPGSDLRYLTGYDALPLERLEDALLLLGGHADAGVNHPDLDPIGHAAGVDGDRGVDGLVPQRVLGDVAEHPVEQPGVSFDSPGVRVDRPRGTRRVRQGGKGGGDDFAEVGGTRVGHEGSGLQPGHVEKVADECFEAVG